MNRVLFDSPLGKLLIAEENGYLREISFFNEKPFFTQKESRVILETEMQLTEYFSLKRKTFELPLKPQGTDFTLLVWKALQSIPYGKTCTYSHIAEMLGNKKASRAVGLACHANPIAIVIPCHRVIGANGKLVGYNAGINTKDMLISLEKQGL